MYFQEDYLSHIGVKYRSGRYPYGSGEMPYQHDPKYMKSVKFISEVEALRKKGMTNKEIAEHFNISTRKFKAKLGNAKDEKRMFEYEAADLLRKRGLSYSDIAKQMGMSNESSVRTLLDEKSKLKMMEAKTTAETIQKRIDSTGKLIEIGKGAEAQLGVSQEQLAKALDILEEKGYVVNNSRVNNVTNKDYKTTIKTIGPPGTTKGAAYQMDQIDFLQDITSKDGGKSFQTFKYPASMDSKRLKIRYAEDGGINKDGLIEIRRNVDDLSLGNSKYAQVRILVDNTHYLKGMAVYSDNLPDGVDVVFNTNKNKNKSMKEVLKPIHDNPSNPFGSLIKPNGQSEYIDKNGKKKLSLINKRAEEGDWDDWSNKLPSQFLAKQNKELINKQLDYTKKQKDLQFEEICSVTNPTLKKQFLMDFSKKCDKDAVTLKAASLPRQRYQVILPFTKIKDNEVYAPNYKDGEEVALIRYPHGGTFEIPILRVNNKVKEAVQTLGKNPKDAIGINSKVAERLSGADFDGDTVMVIPHNKRTHITSTPPLKALEGFDPKSSYPERKGMKYMRRTNLEMGMISNLITDMHILGANEKELARAVKHSMVVIDAEKHKLDYTKSYKDNGIAELKKKYQGYITADGGVKTGATTLLSRAKNETHHIKPKGSPHINPETGEYYYTPQQLIPRIYIDKRGKEKVSMTKSSQMMDAKDARTLMSKWYENKSGHEVEQAYADYANYMKSYANKARKMYLSIKETSYNPVVKEKYKEQVDSLNAKYKLAMLNKPKEKMAQIIANKKIEELKKSEGYLNESDTAKKKLVKKEGDRYLREARDQVGAKREKYVLNDKEWEAIQKGAISPTRLKELIPYLDSDKLKERAMPKSRKELTTSQKQLIKAMIKDDYTNAQIAQRIGKSVTTILNFRKENE